jgi:hypothetical protein
MKMTLAQLALATLVPTDVFALVLAMENQHVLSLTNGAKTFKDGLQLQNIIRSTAQSAAEKLMNMKGVIEHEII